MRGDDQDGMFSYISFHKRVLLDHPLRWIRTIVDRVLEQLSPRFNKLYARAGFDLRSGGTTADIATSVACTRCEASGF
jgi:hypothetical protein